MRKREKAKAKPVPKPTTKQTVKETVRTPATKKAGSRDTTLLIGGLALLVLVLCDNVFLTLSTRRFRGVG